MTVDIDSTLADTLHRAAMIDPDNREATDWLAYAQACAEDSPTDVIALVRALAPMYQIILVTSRPHGAQQETLNWLLAQQVPYDHLVMNDGNHGGATEFKVAAIRALAEKYQVILHLDDWWAVGTAVKEELGIPSVIVRVYAPQVLEPIF